MFSTCTTLWLYMYGPLLVNILASRISFYFCFLLNFSITRRNPKTPAYYDFEEVPSFWCWKAWNLWCFPDHGFVGQCYLFVAIDSQINFTMAAVCQALARGRLLLNVISSPYCTVTAPYVYNNKHYKFLNANWCYSFRTTHLIFKVLQILFPTASLIFTAANFFHQATW